MEDKSLRSKTTPTWQNCVHCPSLLFSSALEFERHIQDKHSIREGSIILCQYGQNGICSALQFGDLRKAGFKYHVREYHLYAKGGSEDWTFYSSSQNLPAVLNDPNKGLSNSSDSSSAIRSLQETLSTYLDVIEMKISKQVAQKSDAFFHAMLSHDTIMEQMAKAVKTVQNTRRNITTVKQNLTQCPLQLISLTRINNNLNNVYELLKLIGTVQQTQPMIQLLLSTSDYVAALDLISSTQKVLLTRLSGIQAFRHLSPQLTEMRRLIHKMLSNEFLRFIVTDLNRPLIDLTDLPDRDKIVSIVSGILRLKEFDFLDIFKAEAMTSIQATIKQCVIEIISERDGNSEIVLRGSQSDNTWLMCNEGIVFLQKVTPHLVIIFKRILSLSSLILDISQMDDVTGNESEEMWTQEEIASISDKIKKMIGSLSDNCNERCANLIVTKTDKDYIFSDLTQLAKLTELIDAFSNECEKITGHYSNTMKLALRSFAMKYIQSLHTERRAQLTNTLNAERWKMADVPYELQSVIHKICEFGKIPHTLQYESGRPDGKYLVINKENYAVVATVQLLIKILLEYCDATKQSPDIVQYLVHCMLELIRLFNSRCCLLVLGAGAIQSAGLKTISTSNLALVSRSLQVVLWLLPLILDLLEKLHSKELTLNGFTSIENDLVSHKQEIENKICIIVSTMLSSQLSSWDAKPPVPSQTFRNISKHLVKLHEALIDILPIEQIRSIYMKVHDNFKDKLREQLVKMNIVANGSPQHGVVTSELTFYLQTLKTLRIINENDTEDNILYDIWLN
ncbi:Vacuolar protein sorting-associated protein 54 [Papilio xuthus]|uniref:Vacuolar protein sorting-associated protein 54 n=1 Tax=Papilio xuthus TaxID=66420 RepID=A0A194PNE8_PAPXU|nr:Vacuolar protein sorting-associated protein 54 [Papilio xuthus]